MAQRRSPGSIRTKSARRPDASLLWSRRRVPGSCLSGGWRSPTVCKPAFGADRSIRPIATRLSDLDLLDIAIDPDTDRYVWTGTLRLADRFRLTLYDAAYLLAQRRALPLASLDMELCDAARALGLELATIPG